MSPKIGRAPAALAVLVFGAVFFWLRDAPILLQHQGSQLVRAAHNLSVGNGLMISRAEPLALYGPLYAVLLAPLELAGFRVGTAAYLLNCAAWAACLPLLALLGRELGSRWDAPVLLLWIVWAPGLYLVRAVRADLLPILLSLAAAVALLRRARRNGRGGACFIGAACGLAGLARYMGFFTLLPVMVAGTWRYSPPDRRQRWRDTLVVCTLGAGPVLAWFARNLVRTGYATGMSRTETREVWGQPGTSLVENAGRVARTLAMDAFSFSGLGVRVWDAQRPGQGQTLLLGGVCAGLLVIALVGTRLQRPAPVAPAARRAARLCLGFSAFYLAVLLVLWTFGNNDPINTRYVAPMYPFLLALAGRALSRTSELPRRWPAVVLALALASAALPNAVKSARLLRPDPGEQLIEDRVWEDRPPTWRHAIDWDNVRRLRDPRDRVYAASE